VTTTSDERSLWASIEASPREDTPKLMLADWYRENNQPIMAHAIQWCVSRQIWPRRTPKGFARKWSVANPRLRYGCSSALPRGVWNCFTVKQQRANHKSYRDAIVLLSHALEFIRSIYEV